MAAAIFAGTAAAAAQSPAPTEERLTASFRDPVSQPEPGSWWVRDVTLDEAQLFEMDVLLLDDRRRPTRVYAVGLPPGATYLNGRLRWTPDFIQGGRTWMVWFVGTQAGTLTSTVARLHVRDTIAPPEPEVVAERSHGNHVHLTLTQTTDDYLDSPGNAGRAFHAEVVVPAADSLDGRSRAPVQLILHGLNGGPQTMEADDRVLILPHDAENTYWWGYGESLPARRPRRGRVPNYSQRRALHLLEWVLKSEPSADADRVSVTGDSMGGAGAVALGLLFGRHFALVEATAGQTIARNHRPRRVAQLSTLWGSPHANLSTGDLHDPVGVWDRLDMVRALAERPEARSQFVFTHHGKDDTVIHFGAAVHASKSFGLSFYEALQHYRVGHYVVWDEGGHGIVDPTLGAHWWDTGWDRLTDRRSFLRRDLPFPAFSRSAADDDPGDGRGTGRRGWHPERGFSGSWFRPGDTGWTGDRAGARNRYLRWDSRRIVDRWNRLELPLFLITGPGAPGPNADSPPVGDRIEVPRPIRVDVTPRRTQAFLCEPNERIRWRFGARTGVVVAAKDGSVTVPGLEISRVSATLELTRTASSTASEAP